MKRLYQKDTVWFAVLWIVIYVIGFSAVDGISESIGIPKLVTVLLGLTVSLVLFGFIRREGLAEYFGLCGFKGNIKDFMFFIPLMVISSVNLWNGLSFNCPAVTAVLSVVSMCFVGLLEEVIFRGLLFKGMSESNVKRAVIVSSLTFGFGHIVNLFLGASVYETVLQLVYASAVGFCYTAIFIAGGSIIPCIISHAVVNSLSVFAVEPLNEMLIIIALVQTLISIVYGVWLLYRSCGTEKKE